MIKRKSLEIVKVLKGEGLLGAEVGVFAGHNAINIIQNLKPKTLYLVDPYVAYNEYAVVDVEMSLEFAKQNAYNLTHTYNPRYIYKKFHEVTEEEIPEKLDFIYIDGCHTYEMLEKDFNKALQFIKDDGIICGHDANIEEVRKFLEEVTLKGCKINFAENLHGEGRDWFYLVKGYL